MPRERQSDGTRRGPFVIMRDSGSRTPDRRVIYIVKCEHCGATLQRTSASLRRAERSGQKGCSACRPFTGRKPLAVNVRGPAYLKGSRLAVYHDGAVHRYKVTLELLEKR